MVEDSLAHNELETAVHFMAKSLMLMRVLEKTEQIKPKDIQLFDALRKKVSSNLKDQMMNAIASQ